MSDNYMVWVGGADVGPEVVCLGPMGLEGEVMLSCVDGFLRIRNVPDNGFGDMVAYRVYLGFMEAHRGGADDVSRALIPVRCDDIEGLVGMIPESVDKISKRVMAVSRMAESTDDLKFLAELSFDIMGRVRESVESLRGRIPDDMLDSLLRSIAFGESYLRSLKMMV